MIILLAAALFSCVKDTGPYTITFDTGGGSEIAPQIIEKGAKLTLPEPPEKPGYTFYGWYYDKAFSFPVNPEIFKAVKNLTLYARWENNENIPHEITFANREFADFYTSKEENIAIFNETVEATISPRPGYRIKEGTVRASSQNTTSISVTKVRNVSETIIVYSFKMPAEDVSVSCEFELREYPINIGVYGEGAVYLSKYVAKMHEEITFTVVPEAGYRLDRIIVNGVILSGPVYSMQPQNTNFYAYFEEIIGTEYNVISDETEGGTFAASRKKAREGVYVYLTAVPDEGYKFDGFLLGGVPIPDYFLMPAANVRVSAAFSPINYEETFALTFEESEGGVVSAPRENYAAGESVKPDIISNAGYILESIYINGRYFCGESFIMPAQDVTVRAVFTADAEEHAITVSAENGEIILNRITAKAGELVSVTDILPAEGYRMNEGSLKYNNNPFGTYFIMPDSPVTVSANFTAATSYTITAYESPKGYIIPGKSRAYAGEIITVTVRAKPGYLDTEGNFTFRYFAGDTQVVPTELYFIMPASDVVIEGDFDTKPSSKRTVTLVQGEGGVIKVSHTSAVAGTLIRIEATPSAGYKLSRLYYPVTVMGETEEIEIADAFQMPDFNITVYAEFESDDVPPSSLKAAYVLYKLSLAGAGIRADYSEDKNIIASLLPRKDDAGYINAVLRKSYATEALLFEINETSEIARIAQSLMDYFGANYPETDFKTYGNIFVVSIGGSASAERDLVFGGVVVYEDFVLYPRENGTYGIVSYIGKSIYVSVPRSYNGRSISRIEADAFMYNSQIVKLSLGAVKEVAAGALDGLTKITTLDLSAVTALAPLALKDCIALTNIIVDGENSTYYADASGALYERLPLSTYRFLRYPAGRTDENYTIRSATVEIAPYAFYNTKLKKINENTPKSVLYISEYAFKDSPQLSEIDLSRVISIKDGAFMGCFAVGTVTVVSGQEKKTLSLNSLATIGSNVFEVGDLPFTVAFNNATLTGNNDFIKISGSGTLKLDVAYGKLDAFRQNPVFQNYTKFFTSTLIKSNEYIIMFESNGGTYIPCQHNENGAKPVPPAPPQKEGYIFGGWYQDEALITPFSFESYSIVYDKKVFPIFAKWIEA